MLGKRKQTDLNEIFDVKGAEPAKEADLGELFKPLAKRRKELPVRKLVVYISGGKVLRNEEEEVARLRTTVFVDNLPNDVKQGELKALFKKCIEHGEKISVRLRSHVFDHDVDRGLFKSHKLNVLKGKLAEGGSCSAYVYFPTEKSYTKALEMDGTVFLEHHIRVEPSTGGADPFPPGTSLFLGNLLLELQDDELRQHFVEKGCPPQKVRIIRDPQTRKGKGFGFVSFPDEATTKSALKTVNGTYLRGRDIRAKRVHYRSKDKDEELRKLRSESAPIRYKAMVREKKMEKGAADRNKAYKDRGAINSERLFEGKRARKTLTNEITKLTKQWKSSHRAVASAASKAKKKVEKQRRDARKSKKDA
eukprot:TRINITY_DN8248_c0_g1_i1.p1 TRINITY_DN8248_c0_g1~~TRINITY_DN8248_c0_g1_i1.p1  ORF type:complete len:382 (+),score=87.53 TRINITY_DN8248_c0_g1_i1:58-1146(+)